MPTIKQPAEYKHVRSLERGLDVLQALNTCIDGQASSSELSTMTGLHRTTVRRLLETLTQTGFVRRSESDDSFRLTLKVRELSEGFTDSEWISTKASPVMGELLQKVVWPSDLSTPDGDFMRVRETTHRFSRLSFHRAMVGKRLPMLMTASGRAYFSYCAEKEREEVLQLLCAGSDDQARLAADPRFIKNLIRRVRTDGMGTNTGEWNHGGEADKIGSIAMPILHQGNAIACLNIIYLARAVKLDAAIERFAPALLAATEKISAALHDMHGVERSNKQDG
ncbi:DNA-binding transcriptional regulator [Eoetvoesiella caeni]|uniref:IclR family transcriptional regulator n=1 Tax=Eoetvoesiella caeni TaxID=645616 RepID=A0A366H9G8_9BURK|nr:DNA-binding transcriptional regulator [Eoetvoesiella caeni]MCI2809629.1 DNA-binding transcriptional regulator [Eoetvoesiella caeni]NYT56125.1 DNA-binding transcriptional regulator [Eoetvoesiella caeni]RBP38890.1 IclR family transcriptional regulator [Eoetvoesiella caeni]